MTDKPSTNDIAIPISSSSRILPNLRLFDPSSAVRVCALALSHTDLQFVSPIRTTLWLCPHSRRKTKTDHISRSVSPFAPFQPAAQVRSEYHRIRDIQLCARISARPVYLPETRADPISVIRRLIAA